VTQELVIKQAGIEDAATVALMLTELNRTVGIVGADREHEKLPENTDVTPQQMESRLRGVEGVETVLVAYADGEPAGFTSLRIIPYLDQDSPYAEVTQLHVRPQFRCRGVASQLVETAEQRAIEAGATCLHILTATDNFDAQAFYRSAGYEVECVDFQKFFERRPVHA
jgi:ribosomal protein S18 acetylase RimI-like enzyme